MADSSGVAGFAPGANPELGGGASGAVAPSQVGYTGPNVVSIIVDGSTMLSGWQAVRLEIFCEHAPNYFQLEVTERVPDSANELVILPGQSCTVMIDNDPVISGYIDRYSVTLDAHQHVVRIIGRGRLEDMVDSSAIVPTMTLPSGTVAEVVRSLAKPYGIPVIAMSGEGPVVPANYTISPGQTSFELVELVARSAGFLAYEDSAGNLILARAGDAGSMSSGIQQGVNVQRAQVDLTMDQRYRDYISDPFDFRRFSDFNAENPGATFHDPDVPSSRVRVLLVPGEMPGEAGVGGVGLFADTRAQWEMARRWGRGHSVRALIDSWRDSSGKLWTPNSFIFADIAAAKVIAQTWVIGTAIFIRDLTGGTTCELLVMPQEAFFPSPTILAPNYADYAPPAGAGNVGAAPAPAPAGPGTPAAAGGSSAAGVPGQAGSPSGPAAGPPSGSPGVFQP